MLERCESFFPGRGAQLSQLWRVKQLEYTWQRSLMGHYAPFSTVTREALAYACEALGLELGADVPVFVRGRSAWAEGVGERLVPVALPPAWYVLVDPGVQVPTAALFQSADLTRDSAPAKISDFAAGTVLDNAFEPVLRRREPAVEAVFEELARIGVPRLTGTGSGCFVEFAHRDAAQEALARLPRRMHAWVAAGVSDSPLRAALARPSHQH